MLVHIFGQHFSVHQLDFVKIKKNIARFLKTNNGQKVGQKMIRINIIDFFQL